MNKANPGHPKPDHDRDGSRRNINSYWKFAHRDWRFWIGLILIFGAMLIYLATQDLSLRPRIQPQPEAFPSPK